MSRARALVASLRGILGTLPGATAIGLHTGRLWALVEIYAATEEDALVLAADLEMGTPGYVASMGRRWLRASSTLTDGTTITVVGPHAESDPGGKVSGSERSTER